jgi:glycosyltransferase involved in cell wall biosynthesis
MSSQKDWPTVAVLIPTFNRGELLTENLKYMSENLLYKGEIKVIVGDDSDNDELAFNPEKADCRFPISYERHAPRLGLGGNLNWLHGVTECEYAIQQDDDHRIIRPLDITLYVERLLSDKTAGRIRLMGVGGHKLEATLEETFWRCSWHSPELYIASNRASLVKLKVWDAMYGLYPLTKFIGECEERYNHICIDIARARIADRLPTLDVLVPLAAPENCWSETGHSWQMEGY